NVTVAEVATAADVSEKTVFNYFPRKEDLVYSRQTEVEEQLVQAVREHGALAGMRRFLTEVFSALAEKGAPDVMATRARIVAASRPPRRRVGFPGVAGSPGEAAGGPAVGIRMVGKPDAPREVTEGDRGVARASPRRPR